MPSSLQYSSDTYQVALQAAGLRCSMTDGYDGYQNALAERGNGILKNEFLFSLTYLPPNQVYQQGKSPAGKSERGPYLIPINV